MELTITERDKKLLVFLAAFVLIVGVGAGVIMPLMNAGQTAAEELQLAEFQKMEMEQKITLMPTLNTKKDSVMASLKENEAKFYPLMNSVAIDKMITEEMLKKGITVRSLDITMPTEGQYTTLVGYDTYLNSFLGQSQTSNQGKPAKDQGTTYAGVYTAQVGLLLSGDRETLQSAIDDFAQSTPKMRIADFTWGANRDNTAIGEQLAVTLELYMAQNVDEYLEAAPQSSDASQNTNGTDNTAEKLEKDLNKQ